jgi:hypothetical protein
MPAGGIGIASEHEQKAHSVAERIQNAQKKPWVSMKEGNKKVGEFKSPSERSRVT